MSMTVYTAPEVAAVRALHPYLAEDGFRALPIRAQIARQAVTVHAAHAAGDRRISMQVMCWWPNAGGRSLDDIMQGALTRADCLLTLSREYGFRDWQAVEDLGDAAPSAAFEVALDMLIDGDPERLGSLLDHRPHLVGERSAYGHRATLLHYLGSNGIESHRQRTPLNAVGLAALLIERGADIAAEAEMYGGGQTAHALAGTSAHPGRAGIRDALLHVLDPGQA